MRVARKKTNLRSTTKTFLGKGWFLYFTPHPPLLQRNKRLSGKKRLGKNDAAKMVFFSLLTNVAEGKFLQLIGGAKEGDLFVLLFVPLDYEYLFWKYRLTRLKNEVIVREKSRFLCAVLSYSATQVKGLQARLSPQKTRERERAKHSLFFLSSLFRVKDFSRARDVGASLSSSSKWHIHFYFYLKDTKNLQ